MRNKKISFDCKYTVRDYKAKRPLKQMSLLEYSFSYGKYYLKEFIFERLISHGWDTMLIKVVINS